MFNKKGNRIKELEGRILELQQELEGIRENEDRLKRVSASSLTN